MADSLEGYIEGTWASDDPREMIAVNSELLWGPHVRPDSHYYTAFKDEVDMFETISQANFLQRPQAIHRRTMRDSAFERPCGSHIPRRNLTHVAARFGYLKCLAFIAKFAPRGTEILAMKDLCFNTPAHYAARYGHLNILEFLAENEHGRKSLSELNWFQWTPAHYALREGHLDVLEFLVMNSSPRSLKCKDTRGKTLAHYAAGLDDEMRALEIIVRNAPNGVELLSVTDKQDFTPIAYIPCRLRKNFDIRKLELEREMRILESEKTGPLVSLILEIVKESTEILSRRAMSDDSESPNRNIES